MAIGIGPVFDYRVDLVMCIDTSKSMSPFIDELKANVLSFYKKFIYEMDTQDPPKSVQQLRIKVIAFRDYGVDSEPILESRFFTLGKEDEELRKFVEQIKVSDSNSEYSNQLQALARAMKSDWVRTGSVRRHVIIMYSDALARPLSANAGQANHTDDMPKDLVELQEWWEGRYMEKRAKRLLVFAPDATPWSDMADWTNTFHIASKAGAGRDDTDIRTCIHLLAQSI